MSKADIEGASARAEAANLEFKQKANDAESNILDTMISVPDSFYESSAERKRDAAKLLLSMCFPSWTCPAALCVYIMLIVDGCMVELVYHACSLQGSMQLDMSKYVITHHMNWSPLTYFFFYFVAIIICVGTQFYTSYMVAWHVRHVLASYCHSIYFSPRVMYSLNSVLKAPRIDQRLQQDLARLQITLGQSGLLGLNITLTLMGVYVYGVKLDWLVMVVTVVYFVAMLIPIGVCGAFVST